MRRIREFDGITSTENPELQLLFEVFQNALDDQFVYIAISVEESPRLMYNAEHGI